MPTREGQGDSGDSRLGETVSETGEMYGVIGDGMAGSWGDVNEGSRNRAGSGGVHGLPSRSEEPRPERDRASVRAKKRGNARGAKGGRDMEAAQTVAGTTTAGVVPSGLSRVRDKVLPARRRIAACL